jgi:Rieske Fe-S protein
VIKKLLTLLALFLAHSIVFASDPIYRTVNTKDLERGILIRFNVNELPVYVLKRRPEEVAKLEENHKDNNNEVESCHKCNRILRSISKDIITIWGFNPSTGCMLVYASSKSDQYQDYGLINEGGFIDPCSNSVFDLSGRKISGPSCSPLVLEIPKHTLEEDILVIDERAYPEHKTLKAI